MPVSKWVTKKSLLITVLIGVIGFAITAFFYKYSQFSALFEMEKVRRTLQSHLLKDENVKLFQHSVKLYLEKKYREEFLLEKPTVRTDFLGCWYSVLIRPKSRPEVVFGLRGNFNSYSKKELPTDIIPKSYHESFPQALWDAKSKDMKTRMKKLFEKHAIPVYEPIIASKSSCLELDYFKMRTNASSLIATSGVFIELCISVPNVESVDSSRDGVIELLGQHFREWPSGLSYAVIVYCCPKFAERMKFRAAEYQYFRYDKKLRNSTKNVYTYEKLKDDMKKLKDNGDIYFSELCSFNAAGMPIGSVASVTAIE